MCRFFSRSLRRVPAHADDGEGWDEQSDVYEAERGAERRGEPIPEHLVESWDFHRIALSGKYQDALIDIQERWSMRDLLDALDYLDLIDAAEGRERSRMERELEATRRGRQHR